MSIIVKNMEMPKSCSKCGWFDMGGGDGYRCTLLRKSFDMWNKISVARDKHCPLVEIPTPHGRLIDADEIEMPCLETTADSKWMEIAIKSTPTVIEAEGRKEWTH